MRHTYIKDPAKVYELSKRLLTKKSFGFDTETTGLDPHKDKVILASVSTNDETVLIDTRDVRCLQALQEPLENENISKLGVNLTFDYMMVRGTSGVVMESCKDFMLAEQCLEAGVQFDGFSLEAITEKYLDKKRDKTLQKSFIGHKGEFSAEQLQYAAEDTADLIPLREKIGDRLLKEGIMPTFLIECNALPAFADITYFGQKLDTDAWKDVMKFNQDKAEEAKRNLEPFFEPFFDRDLFGVLDINYNSQPTILYAMQRNGITVDGEMITSTGKEVRKKIKHPMIPALDNYREAMRAISAYGQNFIDAINPATGRIHPAFWQYGTETGRVAGRGGINVLNIPRDKRFRHAFTTDPSRLISTVDLSGAELRILADQSEDELMVRGFNSGVDFHCYVASMLFGCEVTKKNTNAKLRTPAKTINFMLAYGGGAGRLHLLLNSAGYAITIEECHELLQKYKQTFRGAIHWLDNCKRLGRSQLSMSNINGRRRRWLPPNTAKIHGEMYKEVMKSYKGIAIGDLDKVVINRQVSRLVDEKRQNIYAQIEREAANFMVQSTNVEMTKCWMYELRKEFKKRGYDARMYNSIYDEVVLDVAKKDAEEAHELHKKIGIEQSQKFLSRVPMEVEGILLPYWTK
jgi:DNA polymerase-1